MADGYLQGARRDIKNGLSVAMLADILGLRRRRG
jgi:hypothetical protein